jgi:SAM-dependent methyltransferase
VDAWSSGAAYEGFIGRWSRAVAARFVPWLEPDEGANWVDVGCGSGALTDTVLRLAAPSEVLGVDPSSDFIDHARATVVDERAAFQVGDALALPSADRSTNVVVAGLVLNFVGEPAAAVAEMTRVAVPGGTVAAYVWDYADGMQMLRAFWDAAVELDPGAADLDEAVRFPLCRPEPLRELFEGAGLEDVRQTDITVDTVFTDFDDFWTPFLSGQGPAPGYTATRSPQQQDELRELLRSRIAAHGAAIPMTARAWAIAATRA